MALSLWWILIAAAHGQTTLGVGEVQILPRNDGSDTGSIRLREKNANGTDAVRISAPDSVTTGYRVRMPSAQGSGALTNDGSGNLTWESASAGQFVSIMDYGAANDCSATITSIGGPFDQAYAALGNNGGIIYFPPGCYAVTTTINIGNGTSSTTSTKHSVTLMGAGTSMAAGSEGATILRWTAGDPGSDTPMVKFFGPIHGGGIRDMILDANGVFHVSAVHQFNHIGGSFESVTAMRVRTSPAWFIWTNTVSYSAGSERNHYKQLNITDCSTGSGGIYLDSGVSGLPTRDNVFSGGKICYDGSNSAVYYGIRLRFAERNSFTGFSLAPYSGSGTSSHGILLDGYSSDQAYPRANVFDAVYSETGPGAGAFGAGTGGNLFLGLSSGTPDIAHVKGFTTGGDMFGNPGNPPKVLGSHDIDYDTLIVRQQSGAYNSGGSISFMRQSDIVGRVQYESFAGLTFSAYNLSLGSLQKYWKMNQDGVFESAGAGVSVGRSTNRIPTVYSQYLNTSYVGSDLTPSAGLSFTLGTTSLPWWWIYGSQIRAVNAGGTATISADGQTGGLTVSGLTNTVSLQASGSATLHNTLPYVSGSSNIGSAAQVFNEGYFDNLVSTTDLGVGPVGNAKVYMGGVPYGTMFMLNSGGSVTIQMDAGAGQIQTSGLITGNGFRSGASTGVNITCSGGQKIINPQVVGGIVVGGSCGF